MISQITRTIAQHITRQNLLVALFFSIAIPLTVWWFLANFERKAIEIDSNWQGEAITNPLYAARLFLKRMGIPAKRIEHPLSLDNLPPTSTTIILSTERTTLSEQRIRNLLAWVANGGHLVTAATQYGMEQTEDNSDEIFPRNAINEHTVLDHLQRLLGIYSDELLYYYDTTVLDETDTAENTEDEAYTANYKDSPNWHLSFKDGNTFSIRMTSFHPLYAYDDFNDTQIFSDNGSIFGQHHRYQKGYVTLLGSLELFDNYDIDEENNAEFFWHILHHQDRVPASVWLLHNNEMPSLAIWLWQKAPFLLISLSLLLLAVLISAGQRFGPLIPVPVRNRRSLIEHVRASGYFFWQHKQHAFLLDSMRQAVHQQISHLHPSWQYLNHAEKRIWLEEQTQLPREYINALLNDPLAIQTQDFRRLIQQLETLKSKL